jgi:hypothetical protein
MGGLEPPIQLLEVKRWMAGSSPAMEKLDKKRAPQAPLFFAIAS